MNHQQFKEWLQLSMYNELRADEQSALDQHMHQCSDCRQELEELKKFHATLAEAGAFAPNEELLREARQELRVSLRTRPSSSSLWERIPEFISAFLLPNYKIALGGVTILAAGILLGRFSLSSPSPSVAQSGNDEKLNASLEGEPRIANIRFIDSDASDGNVEFMFDAVSPVHIKGNINDDRVQKVLAHALVNDLNPGVRLRSVNAFASQVENLKLPDREVKSALILAVKTDDNPGVRSEALKTLKSFPFDEEIKQAFLHVLMKDKNPALRIAAINSLDSLRSPRGNEDLMNVLRQRMHSDDNSYVRIRAKAVLEEVTNQ